MVLTKRRDDVRLYLDGNLQFSARDEARYHESLVHVPILHLEQAPRGVLVLGAGDGLAARELLRYSEVEAITIVELDPRILELFSQQDMLRQINDGALQDPRVELVVADAFAWLGEARGPYDLILADLPDPNNYGLSKLYSLTFYLRVFRSLAPGGIFVTQATSPVFANDAFWCIHDTIEHALGRLGAESGIVMPFHVYLPSFGDWGFVMAGASGLGTPRKLAIETRFLTEDTLGALFDFPADIQKRHNYAPNKLNEPILTRYYEQGWRRWFN